MGTCTVRMKNTERNYKEEIIEIQKLWSELILTNGSKNKAFWFTKALETFQAKLVAKKME